METFDEKIFEGTAQMNGQQPEAPFSSFEDCEPYRITKQKYIPRPGPTVTIKGAAVAAPGNITGISAASKAGKSAVAGMILAGAISQSGLVDIPADIAVKPNENSYAVIHFDTEQDAADQQDAHISTLRRAGMEDTPAYFLSYNIRQLKIDQYQAITDSVCQLAAEKFHGIHLILIDGIADYIPSVNDEENANAVVQYFIHLSIKYACAVIIVVHLNPGSEKERGHLGSEIQRKCYGLLSIKKEGDISTLEAKIMRKARNGDIPQISFAYNKTLGYHTEVDTPDKESLKAAAQMQKILTVCRQVFTPPNSFNHTDAVSRIMQARNICQSTAKNWIRDALGMQYIEKGEDGNYRLKPEKGS